jgi:hypothetical protein
MLAFWRFSTATLAVYSVIAAVLPAAFAMAQVAGTTIAVTGQRVPADAGEYRYRGLEKVTIDNGIIGFSGSLSVSEVPSLDGVGSFAGPLDALQKVFLGAPFSSIPRRITNSVGRVAFTEVSFDSTIYAGFPGALIPVAQEGMAAPGTANGVVYGGIDIFVGLNDSNEVAFAARLEGPVSRTIII